MATAQLTNDLLDEFPASKRVGAPSGPRETDVDVVLNKYLADGAVGVLKFLDYNIDDEGNEVDSATARKRAGGRVASLKDRGYSIDNGWVVVGRNGCVYAKYFGAGAVPEEYHRKEKPVGEAVPV